MDEKTREAARECVGFATGDSLTFSPIADYNLALTPPPSQHHASLLPLVVPSQKASILSRLRRLKKKEPSLLLLVWL